MFTPYIVDEEELSSTFLLPVDVPLQQGFANKNSAFCNLSLIFPGGCIPNCSPDEPGKKEALEFSYFLLLL